MAWPTRFVSALLLAGLVLLGAACGPVDPAEQGARPTGEMRTILAELDRLARGDNPYLGEHRARQLRAELSRLPPEPPDLRRWFFSLRLGREELRLGRTDAALGHYAVAYEQLALWSEEIPPKELLRTIFELGVAEMRAAETANCVTRHNSQSCLLPIREGGLHLDRHGSIQALERFSEVLELAPPGSEEAIRATWLFNIVAMTLGRWPDEVPAPWRIPAEAFASGEPFPAFPEVAGAIGLDRFDLAGSFAVEDYDGDGLLDIVETSSDTAVAPQLYRNRGDGLFELREGGSAGLAGLFGGLNLTHADYDNDGDVDLLILRGAWWRKGGRHPNSLLRNDGGRFTDVTFQAGLAEPAWPTQAAAWADYDGDGDLDLYIGNEADPDVPAPGQLFRNNADGTFTDVAAFAGVENRRYAKAVAWGDYDDDGDPDLYVSNLAADNRLYRNAGDGTFEDVAPALGVTGPHASFAAWFWDYDNDGALDLFVAGYGGRGLPPDVADVAASYLGIAPRAERARVYRGDGRGGFGEVGAALGLERITLPMGANFGDIDGDGWLDFYLGTGYPYYEGIVPNVMYRNRAGVGFVDVSAAGGFGHLQKGHGIAFADLDEDGDQDLLAQMGGMYPGDGFGNALFENPGFGQRWIKLRLIGVRANRSAIGAQVTLDVTEQGRTRSIRRTVGSGGSFGANPLRLEIGLAHAERILALEVVWPGSGAVQRFEDVGYDRSYRLVEGGTLEPATPVAFDVAG